MDPNLFREIYDYIEQKSYPSGVNKKEKYVIRQRAANFTVTGGVLYHCAKTKDGMVKKAKVVCGAQEADDIFLDIHASPQGAHSGIIKTRNAICSRYYWPAMTIDIDKWVSECESCQKEGTEIKAQKETNPIQVTRPWERLEWT